MNWSVRARIPQAFSRNSGAKLPKSCRNSVADFEHGALELRGPRAELSVSGACPLPHLSGTLSLSHPTPRIPALTSLFVTREA
jgi:hypothetical protein